MTVAAGRAEAREATLVAKMAEAATAVVATAEVAKAGARKGGTGRVAAARAEAVQVMVPAAVMGSCAWQAGALRSALGL